VNDAYRRLQDVPVRCPREPLCVEIYCVLFKKENHPDRNLAPFGLGDWNINFVRDLGVIDEPINKLLRSQISLDFLERALFVRRIKPSGITLFYQAIMSAPA
tara:strand:+ start:280 stop:585 length:306 start_codon:yes stop_codon:yes gene_type:complete